MNEVRVETNEFMGTMLLLKDCVINPKKCLLHFFDIKNKEDMKETLDKYYKDLSSEEKEEILEFCYCEGDFLTKRIHLYKLTNYFEEKLKQAKKLSEGYSLEYFKTNFLYGEFSPDLSEEQKEEIIDVLSGRKGETKRPKLYPAQYTPERLRDTLKNYKIQLST